LPVLSLVLKEGMRPLKKYVKQQLKYLVLWVVVTWEHKIVFITMNPGIVPEDLCHARLIAGRKCVLN
jgi:hypothetical protein